MNRADEAELTRPNHTVLCSGTLGRIPFREKIDAAAAAGFAGISVYYRESHEPEQVRRALADAELFVAELDGPITWLPNWDGPPAPSVAEVVDRAAALGARSFTVVEITGVTPPLDVAIESFATCATSPPRPASSSISSRSRGQASMISDSRPISSPAPTVPTAASCSIPGTCSEGPIADRSPYESTRGWCSGCKSTTYERLPTTTSGGRPCMVGCCRGWAPLLDRFVRCSTGFVRADVRHHLASRCSLTSWPRLRRGKSRNAP